MKLLAVETATDACSAALIVDGECIERHAIAPRQHAELILEQVSSVLEEAGLGFGALDALAFGRGPGSFTGLRIASGVVQGLATGAGLGVVPVSSLRAVAQGAVSAERRAVGDGGGAVAGVVRALVAFDARMGELYFAGFELGDGPGGGALMIETIAERVCPPEAVDAPASHGWAALGDGWAAHGEALRARLGHVIATVDASRLPRARDVARIACDAYLAGETVAPREAVPVYLRDQVTRAAPRAGGRRGGGEAV